MFRKKCLPATFNKSASTKSVKSGSSPYQNIQSSLAAANDSGGCTLEVFTSNIAFGSELSCLVDCRLQTHKMSACMHREYERSIGSSSGSLDAFGRSLLTNFRHFIPHKSVYKEKKKKKKTVLKYFRKINFLA